MSIKVYNFFHLWNENMKFNSFSLSLATNLYAINISLSLLIGNFISNKNLNKD